MIARCTPGRSPLAARRSRLAGRFPGFTLIELLVVIAIIGILASLLLPALARTKARGQVAICQNHLRQLSLALVLYADDFRGVFPPRADSSRWPTQLKPTYRDLRVLTCPNDVDKTRRPAPASAREPQPDAAKRSFIINGWNDYFLDVLKLSFASIGGRSLPESAVGKPSETIVFGEKVTGSDHFYMDCFEGQGNDVDQIERARHMSSGKPPTSGYSNYAFADGSARLVKCGQLLYPLNLWMVTDYWRTNRVFSK